MSDIDANDRVAANEVNAMNSQEERDRRIFGETLRSLRGYAGLSRRELARLAGLPVSRVARLERGKAAPDEDARANLERAIGCPLYWGMHQAVNVRVGDRVADIDVGIAPLIRELWVAGIGTFSSCQQDTLGRIGVQFSNAYDADEFLSIVARYEPGDDDLYWRMKAAGTGQGTLPDWEYSTNVDDLALHEEIIDDCEQYSYEPPAEFRFTISVLFPPQDLPTVLQRLQDHNKVQEEVRGKGTGI
jgi:transcriptional regulator with XRE-family HTH domain